MSTATSEPLFEGGGRVRPLTVRRSARARRMRLVVDPRDGAVRLTLPRRAALGPALEWVDSQRGWVEAALAALPTARPLGSGALLPFEGADRVVDWRADYPRRVRLVGGRLEVGGPEELVRARLLRWLASEARARLEPETRACAARAGVSVGRVRLGDPRTRWGSCSSSGDIAYSWRLVMAPPAVREATVVHEVTHRLHMHHGPDFHAAVARLLGREPVAERAWLKANGAMLQAIGR